MTGDFEAAVRRKSRAKMADEANLALRWRRISEWATVELVGERPVACRFRNVLEERSGRKDCTGPGADLVVEAVDLTVRRSLLARVVMDFLGDTHRISSGKDRATGDFEEVERQSLRVREADEAEYSLRWQRISEGVIFRLVGEMTAAWRLRNA